VVDVSYDLVENVSAGTTLYVNTTGSGGAYTRIQEAINASFDGDTIFVYNGTYYENIKVNKSINLIGEGRKNVNINGSSNGDVVLVEGGWVNISGFTITGSGAIPYNAGIHLLNTHNSTIIDNNISFNNNLGITVSSLSKDNLIMNNDILYNELYGIRLNSSFNNNITNNSIINNRYGVYFSLASNNYMAYNNISGSLIGIYIYASSFNNFKFNTMKDNGFYLFGDLLEHWNTHVIDDSNTVNDNPVYYWKNIDGGVVPNPAGQVILANCTNSTVNDQEFINNSIGINVGFSSNNTLENNLILNNEHGLLIYNSSYNNILNNSISSSKWWGIFIQNSLNNEITNNNISNNDIGIYMTFSDRNLLLNNKIQNNLYLGLYLPSSNENIITSNTVVNSEYGIHPTNARENIFSNNSISNNYYGFFISWSDFNNISYNSILHNNYGIRTTNCSWNNINYNIISSNTNFGIYFLLSSNNNTIHHNDLINNSKQVDLDDSYDNVWDNGMGEGNYWSDYYGFDDGSSGRIMGDGIGDTKIPHPFIDQGNGYYQLDNFPLMEPVFDSSFPRIQLISPNNESVFQSGVILDYSVYDENLSYANFSINSGSEQLFLPPYDINTTEWADGEYKIFINAVDLSGNINSSWYFFTIDSTPPDIILNFLENNSIISSSDILDFSIYDLNLITVNYSINEGDNTSFLPPFNVSTLGWSEGENNVRIDAVDIAGNSNSSIFFFTFDSTKPTIILNNPENNTRIKPGTVLDFSVADLNLGNINYSINGETNNSLVIPFNISSTGWQDGIYTIWINAEDLAGNTNSSWFDFEIDSTPPEINLDQKYNHSTIPAGEIIHLDIIALDLDVVQFSIDDGEYNNLISPHELNTSAWEDGLHKIIIKANDTLGNEAVRWFEITIDAILPYVVSANFYSGSIAKDQNPHIVVNFSEPMNKTYVEDHLTLSPSIEFTSQWDHDGQMLTIFFESVDLSQGINYTFKIDKQISDINGNQMESDYLLNFYLGSTEPTPNPSESSFPYWILALIGIIIVVLVLLFLLLRRSKKEEDKDLE
jgi:parallel beta-helix repeat protein